MNALDTLLGFTSFLLGVAATERKIARVVRFGESLGLEWDEDSGTLTVGGNRWGTTLEVTGATATLTAEQVNGGLLVLAGRAGAQAIVLPTEGVTDGCALLVLGYHSSISASNAVTVVIPGGTDGEIEDVDGSLGYVWAKTRWIRT